jgi:hypothetical protein
MDDARVRRLTPLAAIAIMAAGCVSPAPGDVPEGTGAVRPAADVRERPIPAGAEDLGACLGSVPGGRDGHHVMSLADRLAFTGPWFRYDADAAVEALTPAPGDGADVVDVGTGGAELLHGEGRADVRVGREVAERALDAATGGNGIIIAGDVQPDDPTNVVVMVDDAGRVGFLGHCHFDRYTVPLAGLAHARFPDAPPVDVLLALVRREPAALTALRGWSAPDAPAPWHERSPDERLLDPEGTPADVLGSLDLVTLAVTLPEGWRDEPGAICTRVPQMGWNECADLGLRRQPISMSAYVDRSRPLELWLLTDEAPLDRPMAQLGHVSPKVIETALDAECPSVIAWSPAGSAPELSMLVERPDLGAGTFSADVVPQGLFECPQPTDPAVETDG